jgi:hypothetical protein
VAAWTKCAAIVRSRSQTTVSLGDRPADVPSDLLGPALVDRVAAREPVDQLDVFVGELESAVVERRFPRLTGGPAGAATRPCGWFSPRM